MDFWEKVFTRENLENSDFNDIHNRDKEYWEHRQVSEWLEELKSYRDAEEQGLLLRLPCKVGDTVWFIDSTYDCKNKTFSNFVHNGYVKAIKFSSRPTKITVEYENLMDSGRCKGCDYNIGNIGKTVFLTKAEAEEALAKMDGGAE